MSIVRDRGDDAGVGAVRRRLAGIRTGIGRTGWIIIIVIAISALNPVAVNIVLPAMSSIATGLGVEFSAVQFALTLYLIATACAQVFIGPVSDHLGRRPVALAGLGVFIVGSLLAALSFSIVALDIGRILQGAGACAGVVLGRAIIRDLHGRERSASVLGYVTVGSGVAPMLAPLVGGLIDDHFGWRLAFLLMSLIAGAILAITATRLVETRVAAVAETPAGVRHSIASLMHIPAFWTYTLTSSFGSAVFYAFLAGTPFAAKYIYALSGARYGVFYIFVACGFLLGNYITGALAPRLGLFRLIITGNLICFFTILALAASFFAGLNTPLVLFGAMLVVNFSNGLVMPNSLAGAMSIRPELAGSASGIAGSFQIAAGALAITAVGALVSPATFETAFVAVTLVFSGGALLTGLYTPHTQSRRDAAAS